MGLFDAIRVGLTGIHAAEAGLEAAQNNVVNVNTPGYARLRTNLEEVVLAVGPHGVPGGVRVTGFQAARSAILDARVAGAEAGLGAARSALGYLGELERTIAPQGVSLLAQSADRLFASFQELAVRPEDRALRSQVLGAAGALADRVRSQATSLAALSADVQRELGLRASRVNDLARSIAALNRDVAASPPGSAAREAIINRQTALVNELSREIDVRSVRDQDGALTVSLSNGEALVAADRTFALAVDSAPGGAVSLGATNVTAYIGGGAMGGILSVRDASLLPALEQLDTLARAIAMELNGQHRLGYDLKGAPGGDLFAAGTGTQLGLAAQGFRLLIEDPDEVAAALVAAPGDGRNAELLAGLGAKPGTVFLGAASASLREALGLLSERTGSEARRAEEEAGIATALHEQAVAAREQLSGVSLDEEAVDMIRYQRAYQASARFLATMNDLLGELINTVR